MILSFIIGFPIVMDDQSPSAADPSKISKKSAQLRHINQYISMMRTNFDFGSKTNEKYSLALEEKQEINTVVQ